MQHRGAIVRIRPTIHRPEIQRDLPADIRGAIGNLTIDNQRIAGHVGIGQVVERLGDLLVGDIDAGGILDGGTNLDIQLG